MPTRFPQRIPTLALIPQAVARGGLISELVAQRFPKRIPTLTLTPPCGCKGSLDIGAGGPEVPKAHSNIALDNIVLLLLLKLPELKPSMPRRLSVTLRPCQNDDLLGSF